MLPAVRALARLDVGVLSDGVQVVTGVHVAVLSLDSAMLADLLVERRWRRVGTVRALPLRGRGWAALLWAEARRAARSPGLAAGAAAGVLAPHALAAVAPGAVLPALLVGAYLVARRYAGGLRRLESSRALRHGLPYGDLALRLLHCALPGLAALAWAAAGALAAPTTSYPAAALGAGLAELAGAIR